MSAAPDGSKLTTSVSEHSFSSRSVSVGARYLGWRLVLTLTAELAWLLASGTALGILSQVAEDPADSSLLFSQVGTLVITYLGAFYLMDLYDLDVVTLRWALVLNLTQAIGLVSIAAGILEYFGVFAFSPLLLMLHLSLTATFVLIARAGIDRFVGTRSPLVRIGFLGGRIARAELEEESKRLASLGFSVESLGESFSQARNELQRLVRKSGIRRLVIDETCLSEPAAVGFLQECKRAGIEVEKLRSFQERAFGKMRLGPHVVQELAVSDGRSPAILNSGLRRARDILLAGAALLLTLPLSLMIAAAIKCDSPGPVFFSQDRVGKNGRRFKMLKFRSMRDDAMSPDGRAWTTSERDPRVTRVGALMRGFHLDELPQLINVIKGDMSLVGPRPFHPLHFAQLESAPYFKLRLLVLPGITGWAQVRCDYSASVDKHEEVLARDLYYVKHGGLFFDLLIILETIRICLWRRGAR
jgi:exopolysaccharide biosynthesis polyprenyl glycosylphosphotransferase